MSKTGQFDQDHPQSPWWGKRVQFEYGVTPSEPDEPPPGHIGMKVGAWGVRVVCQTCGEICLPDHKNRAWLSSDLTHVFPFGLNPENVQGMSEAMFSQVFEPVAPSDGPGRDDEPKVAPTPAPTLFVAAARPDEPEGRPRRVTREDIGMAGYVNRSKAHGAIRAELPSRSRVARKLEQRRTRANRKRRHALAAKAAALAVQSARVPA
jgi:hypothetical protein